MPAIALVAVSAVIAVACGATPPAPVGSNLSTGASPASVGAPAGPLTLGIDWGRATQVERPLDAFPQPSPGASLDFSLGSNRSGHPLHSPGQAIMADVARLPSGGLVSVGYVYVGLQYGTAIS